MQDHIYHTEYLFYHYPNSKINIQKWLQAKIIITMFKSVKDGPRNLEKKIKMCLSGSKIS